ncbi:MAG TPA: HD domain-containing protein [Promineifilum sp.]|nr:HD domain-containing protein [Promineifilum sp.]
MLSDWEPRFEQFIEHAMEETPDPAHDREHVRRVVANARQLAAAEGADPAVVVPAAWLHDCVVVPKDSVHRARASQMAAERAGAFLREAGYPAEYIPAIEHAIAAHSFSAGIPPQTREAQVVQDADRLDALGAIGIARTLLLGGMMGKPLYDHDEPLPKNRAPNDKENVIDHFYVKLLGLAAAMHTAAARREGERRTRLMRDYLQELAREISGDSLASAS